MNPCEDLDPARTTGLARYLDRKEILLRTVEQLNKDLALSDVPIAVPAPDDQAFEQLRAQVLPILQEMFTNDPHGSNVAMYRVDISQKHRDRALAKGGLYSLAGEVVLRCLQKVLTRMRFAGEF